MKKRCIVFFLACILTTSALFAGCGTAGKIQEYKTQGLSYMETGEYEAAAESFQKALDQSRGTVGAEELDACYYKALAKYKAGDVEGALEVYNALLGYDAENWEVYYLRGNIYLKEGETEKALADYQKAVANNKEDLELCVNIFENLVAAGEEEAGQSYYKKVISVKPSKGLEYYYVGDMYFLTGDYDQAKKYLTQAKDKGYDQALLMLGQTCAAEGQSEEAKQYFEAYMNIYPDDAIAINELGAFALKAEEYDQALSYLQTAMELADSSTEQAVRKNLIAAYEFTGDFQSAYEEADKFLKISQDAEVQREYEFLQTRVK